MRENTQNESKENSSQDVILDLNFVPQWARKPPGENHYRDLDFKERAGGGSRERRDRMPREERRTDSSDRRTPRRPRPEEGGEERRPRENRPERQPIEEYPVSISFLPEQKRLASLVRQIHHTRRAYPLMDLASIFLQDADGYMVKVEVEKGNKDFFFYQCKCCKSISAVEDIMIRHIQSSHLEEFFIKEQIETEAPSGVFSCVARCKKSGVLLGPPNHHSYTEKLNELHQSRFGHLTLDEYKRTIETVRDEALIEQWKEESRQKTVYRAKDSAEPDPMSQSKAETAFTRMIPTLYEKSSRAIISSRVAQKLEDRNMTQAIRRVWQKESHFPLSLSFSLRAAFRHMHLYIFKAGKINFVTHIKPFAIKPEDTVDHIREILTYLSEHAGSSRPQMLEALRPGADPKSPEASEVLKPLGWLIERGHIIEFFNGTLSVPLGSRR
jgi:hypothetical protein